jgi:acetyl esterase/lipase
MIKTVYAVLFLIFLAGLLYHFAALKTFNFIIPKDQESQFIAGNLAYGEDRKQHLDIYAPVKKHENLPILIFVHGGSWQQGNQADYEFSGRAFAAKGYLTVVISYRALPTHAYPDFITDVALAVKWATIHGADYGGDASNIFLVGHSAGAYDAALAVLDQTYIRSAGVDPAVIKGVATLAGPFDFLPLDSPITIATFGHLKDLAQTQPINFVRADAPPFLLLHGTADTTVYPKNSRSLFKHLTDAGGLAKAIEYQNVSHVGILLALAKPLRGTAPVLLDIDDFFRDILK